MGRTVCEAVHADSELELVAAVDAYASGIVAGGIEIKSELRAIAESGAQVAVDFTVIEAARVNLPWLALHGVHAVVGTTDSATTISRFTHRSSSRATV